MQLLMDAARHTDTGLATLQRLSLGYTLMVLVLALAACGGGETGSAPTRADFFAEQDAVSYRRAAGNAHTLASGASTNLAVDDAFATDAQGEARLVFLDCLALRVFANTSLQVDQRDQSIECQTRFSMAKGAIEATKRIGIGSMEIATKWAVIKDLDTTYFVHYDDGREMTWVVVKRGAASVTAAGVEVIVHAGQQTWVEPGKAPIDPVLACRDLVGPEGTLFPEIDVLTNGGITDLEWLPCPATPTPTSTPTPLPAPATPTPRPPPTLTPYANFIADPPSIQACACTNLRWDAGNVASVAIDGAAVPAQGSQEECPSSTTTYNLRAVTAKGAAIDRSASVQVAQPSIDFRADSTSLSYPGECTTLRWDVENVQGVFLDGQGVAGQGNRQVCPSSTATYNLRVNTACGPIDRIATVQVLSDTLGPEITNVRAYTNSDLSYLCIGRPVTIEAIISDPAGIGQATLAMGLCTEGSGNECSKVYYPPSSQMADTGSGLFFDEWSGFDQSGTLGLYIVAVDEYGNKSEVGVADFFRDIYRPENSAYTFEVMYCSEID